MMKRMILGPIIAVAFIGLAGFVVMELWNWLMPEIFDLGMINFWQALGLIILSKIFFGGWGMSRGCGCQCGGGYSHGGHYWKRKFKNKWANMSPEEKEKWKTKFGDKCSTYSESKQANTTSSEGEGITVESASDESSSEGEDGYSK